MANLTPSSSNLGCKKASSKSSEEHTGVKSAGWLNSIFQLSPKSLGNLIFPFVEFALKLGASDPINGIVFFCAQMVVEINSTIARNKFFFHDSKKFIVFKSDTIYTNSPPEDVLCNMLLMSGYLEVLTDN